MDQHEEHVYLAELEAQCRLALLAVDRLNEVLPRLEDRSLDFGMRDKFHREVFRNLHSLLTHSANVSKLLWPGGREQKAGADRAAHLRDVLGLDEASRLRDRTLRDHLDHYDARLDEWARKSERKNLVQDFIGPLDAIGGVDDVDRMRSYDPSTHTMHFRGEAFDIQELAAEVHNLLGRVVRREKSLFGR